MAEAFARAFAQWSTVVSRSRINLFTGNRLPPSPRGKPRAQMHARPVRAHLEQLPLRRPRRDRSLMWGAICYAGRRRGPRRPDSRSPVRPGLGARSSSFRVLIRPPLRPNQIDGGLPVRDAGLWHAHAWKRSARRGIEPILNVVPQQVRHMQNDGHTRQRGTQNSRPDRWHQERSSSWMCHPRPEPDRSRTSSDPTPNAILRGLTPVGLQLMRDTGRSIGA